ncbi:hypothetical protein PO909_015957 [Leuciscus waleckii]
MMDVKLLCLTVVLLSSPLLTLCDPLFVLSAPNLLRVGSSENVFVEAQDYFGGNLNVRISVKNFPKKDREIVSKAVTLTVENNFQILTDIKADDYLFSRSLMILWRSSMCIYKLSFHPTLWRKWSWSHSSLDTYLYRQTSPSTRLLAQFNTGFSL